MSLFQSPKELMNLLAFGEVNMLNPSLASTNRRQLQTFFNCSLCFQSLVKGQLAFNPYDPYVEGLSIGMSVNMVLKQTLKNYKQNTKSIYNKWIFHK